LKFVWGADGNGPAGWEHLPGNRKGPPPYAKTVTLRYVVE